MSREIPLLRDRQGFDAWKRALGRALTPEEVTTVNERVPKEKAAQMSRFRHQISAYQTMIASIDDSIISGLIAHGNLGAKGDPSSLLGSLASYLAPNQLQIAEQVKKLLSVQKFQSFRCKEDIVPYLQLIKVAVDHNADDPNPTLVALLVDTLHRTGPHHYSSMIAQWSVDIDWHGILDELSGKAEQRKRDAEERERQATEMREAEIMKVEAEERRRGAEEMMEYEAEEIKQKAEEEMKREAEKKERQHEKEDREAVEVKIDPEEIQHETEGSKRRAPESTAPEPRRKSQRIMQES